MILQMTRRNRALCEKGFVKKVSAKLIGILSDQVRFVETRNVGLETVCFQLFTQSQAEVVNIAFLLQFPIEPNTQAAPLSCNFCPPPLVQKSRNSGQQTFSGNMSKHEVPLSCVLEMFEKKKKKDFVTQIQFVGIHFYDWLKDFSNKQSFL